MACPDKRLRANAKETSGDLLYGIVQQAYVLRRLSDTLADFPPAIDPKPTKIPITAASSGQQRWGQAAVPRLLTQGGMDGHSGLPMTNECISRRKIGLHT